MQEQPFRVLCVLLERPGEVVTREQLQERVWPADTYVGFDEGINTAIRKLRLAFGDSAENPRFIETLPRRGYRFIAPISESPRQEETVPAPGHRAPVPGPRDGVRGAGEIPEGTGRPGQEATAAKARLRFLYLGVANGGCFVMHGVGPCPI